jgi:hypothetical protein
MLRVLIWVALSICLLLDGALAQDAISPGGCMIYMDKDWNWIPPKSSPHIWLWIAGFVLLQGVLIFAQIRLRSPRSTPPSIFQRS